jgi:hypothetical protein
MTAVDLFNLHIVILRDPPASGDNLCMELVPRWGFPTPRPATAQAKPEKPHRPATVSAELHASSTPRPIAVLQVFLR